MRISSLLYLFISVLSLTSLAQGASPRSAEQRQQREIPEHGVTNVSQHLVLVMDCSSHDKRVFARSIRQAAHIVNRLADSDTVSVILFDEVAELLVPATSAVDKASIVERLKALKQRGRNRALFAGIAKGADEVRRNSSAEQAKRIMVFQGNGTGTLIGPGSPEDVRTLQLSLGKEGITLVIMQGGRGSASPGRRGANPRRRDAKGGKGGASPRPK